ncbi:MAG: ribosome assembly RNA-binding protein YhbY [Xanthomonadales bacterium]|nr:ribosome assembly RNA-binding protein YhbY [Xanthomonadales bacterium]
MSLKAAQKKNLRGQAHHLKPLVIVADKGLSDTVVAEIERALNDHELIKVKLRGEREERKAWALSIAKKCKAELVQTIGQVACYYRKHPEKPVINPG